MPTIEYRLYNKSSNVVIVCYSPRELSKYLKHTNLKDVEVFLHHIGTKKSRKLTKKELEELSSSYSLVV